jgi:hypothetical protein
MFVFPAVPPGQYIVTTRAQTADRRLMPDWEAKGPSLQGRDISDRPLTITNDISDILIVQVQTDHNSELKGIVRDASGKVDPTATVLLFTAEKELWPLRMTKRIRALRATENGTYSVRGAPPGDYYLVAIPDVDIADYPDPAMLEVLARTAMRISMTATDLKTLDLVVKKIK